VKWKKLGGFTYQFSCQVVPTAFWGLSIPSEYFFGTEKHSFIKPVVLTKEGVKKRWLEVIVPPKECKRNKGAGSYLLRSRR